MLMFPGMGGMDPKQMGSLLKQMGVKTKEIDADKVVVHCKDGSLLTVTAPSVTEIDFRGQKSFQVGGDVHEEKASGQIAHQEDVKIVMGQTGASAAQAQAALDSCGGNLAEAILKLGK